MEGQPEGRRGRGRRGRRVPDRRPHTRTFVPRRDGREVEEEAGKIRRVKCSSSSTPVPKTGQVSPVDVSKGVFEVKRREPRTPLILPLWASCPSFLGLYSVQSSFTARSTVSQSLLLGETPMGPVPICPKVLNLSMVTGGPR